MPIASKRLPESVCTEPAQPTGLLGLSGRKPVAFRPNSTAFMLGIHSRRLTFLPCQALCWVFRNSALHQDWRPHHVHWLRSDSTPD